jgi:hypothetical protein
MAENGQSSRAKVGRVLLEMQAGRSLGNRAGEAQEPQLHGAEIDPPWVLSGEGERG